MKNDTLLVRSMKRKPYQETWDAMREFTIARDDTTPDEIWALEHEPVFTQGQNGKPEHVLNPNHIPVVQTDRGGQVTYHGPGQLMVYTLIDIKRKGFNVRELVTLLELSVIEFLASYQIQAKAKREAPGVYVDDKKICSIGLRIKKGSAYHGIAFNLNMDLTPFSYINPCGYQGLQMTDLYRLAPSAFLEKTPENTEETVRLGKLFCDYLIKNLKYDNIRYKYEENCFVR